MTNVRLNLLGGFELTLGDEPVTLQPAMERLLALVALAPRGVDRLFAALQLWPDSCEDRAKANLRSTLWRLRKLPLEVLGVTGSRLRLADHVWIDVRHGVEEMARGGDALLESALPFRALLSDLLPDWYDDWLIIEREQLRQLTLSVLESHAQAALDRGDTATAIQLALSAAAVDPLRESAHRIVISAHVAEGNHWEARRNLAAYRDLLAAGTHLEPSPALERLLDPPAVAV